MRVDGKTILFGGDLGRFGRPVLPDPTMVAEADYLLVESTYGDRVHEQDDDGTRLAAIVNETVERGGKLIIPSFAIGRVEELIYWLRRLERETRIPVLPVFVDSPMAAGGAGALHASGFTSSIRSCSPSARRQGAARRAPLTSAVAERRRQALQERDVCAFCTERFRVVATVEESKQLTASKAPAIVISSSGMAEGGRVLHHLKAALPDPATPSCSSATRPPARAAAGWSMERRPSRYTASGCRGRADRAHRFDVGPRRLERDPALAARLHARSQGDVHRPRRGHGHAGAVGAYRPGARLDTSHARAPRERRTRIETMRSIL